MACSNKALYMRETGCLAAYTIGYAFGFIGIIAVFVAMSVATIVSSVVIPIGEERTRKHLVDYLQNNEKITEDKPNRKRTTTKATAK